MTIIFIKDEENIKLNSIFNLEGNYNIDIANIEGGKYLLCFKDLETDKYIKTIEYKNFEYCKAAYNSIVEAIVKDKNFVFI